MQALFDSHLHLDWFILFWFFACILDNEFFLFGYSVVVAIDHHINEVAQTHNDTIV